MTDKERQAQMYKIGSAVSVAFRLVCDEGGSLSHICGQMDELQKLSLESDTVLKDSDYTGLVNIIELLEAGMSKTCKKECGCINCRLDRIESLLKPKLKSAFAD